MGDPSAVVTKALLTLDCTEDVVREAAEQGCNLIIAHHPIVFRGLKKLNGKNYVERTVLAAIKQDIALYAIHTNLDAVKGGVNWKIAEKLGLENIRILSPKKQLLEKLTVFVPQAPYAGSTGCPVCRRRRADRRVRQLLVPNGRNRHV